MNTNSLPHLCTNSCLAAQIPIRDEAKGTGDGDEEGSPPVFKRALVRYRGFLESLAQRYVSADDEAQDLVQETYLTALRNPPPSTHRIRGWLAKVLRNLATNRFRRESLSRSSGWLDEVEGGLEDPVTTAEKLGLQKRVHRALTRLDEKHRLVLHLRYYHDLPPRKIAARLGIPVETVRSRHRRALARLRYELGRDPITGRRGTRGRSRLRRRGR